MTTPATDRARLVSVDLIRGAVMVLMAIDHVRVYAGIPAGGPTPGVFFTRWITHFCAPAFVFLAGTSAFFYGRRHADLPRFLVTRGLWLIVLELTVLRVAWTFNLDFAGYNLLNVIWALGWCMIILAVICRLPLRLVGALGVLIIALHNLLPIPQGGASALWKILYVGFWNGPFRLGEHGPRVMVLYSLIPWIGVMAAGFAFGAILTMEPARRDRLCRLIGLGAMALFLVLRAFNLYGDPFPWRDSERMPGALAFLATNKYPASLLFLLMTLGPVIALIPVLERARGRVAGWVSVFGRVPFFYYVLHIPLIHLLALGVSYIRLGAVSPWLFENHPMGAGPQPAGYTWSLPLLYLVFAITVVALYFPSRWFAGLKARRNDWWLKYL